MQWTQLGPGTLVTQRQKLDFGTIVLRRRQYQTAFRGDGVIPEGHTLFGFTSGVSFVTRWTGLDVSSDDIATTRGEVDVSARAAETHYAIVVSDNAYRDCGLPESVRETLNRVPSGPALVRSAHAGHLRDYVAGLLDVSFSAGCLSITSVCKNLLWLLAAAVGIDGESLAPTRPQGRRIDAVRQCQAYIERKLGEPVCLSDLSLVSGLRPRTLINAFEAVTGASPMAYLRARRLSRVRTVLESARSERVRIIDVAVDWGFWHMGHFTTAYRTMFGETPSETLTRCTKAK